MVAIARLSTFEKRWWISECDIESWERPSLVNQTVFFFALIKWGEKRYHS